jgi:serine/threonine-protein kinase
MTMKNPQTCLSAELLRQLSHDELSPAELKDVEDHVSDCERCRQLLEVPQSDPQWQDEIAPILRSPLETPRVALGHDDHGSEGESLESILRLLGPTDDPHMFGRIGSYEVVGVIGRGGMGVVFKAYEGALNRFVAIKMLLPHLAASGAARKRFAREGQAAAAVIDDNVMPIYSVAEWQGVPYLVTQYSRGATLQKRIQDQGPLELKEILRIGMQTARGLAAAHAQGLVHRDVKPSNILLDGTVERALLTDFGLARAVDDASITRTGVIAGTPQYMSPEQARGGSVDARSDLFGLGCVLYAMCTGRPPFRADSSYAILRMITDDEPRSIREINPDIPEWLCLLISRLMAKLPDARFENAVEVAALLEQCLAHVQQPTSVPLPASLSSLAASRRSISNVTRKGVIAILGTIGMILLGIVLWQATEPLRPKVGMQSGISLEPKLLSAKLPDGLSVALVGITKNTRPANEGWLPDGSKLSEVAEWPTGNFLWGNDSSADNPDNRALAANARDLLFEFRGLRGQPSFWFEPTGTRRQIPVADPYRLRYSICPPNPSNAPDDGILMLNKLRVGLTDESWGPWQRISAAGELLNQLGDKDLYWSSYSHIELQRVEPSRDHSNRTLLVLRQPKHHSRLFDFEICAFDTDGQEYKVREWQSRSVENTDLEESEWSVMNSFPDDKQLARFEYRLRPYRHWITFENVSLQPGEQTDVKVKVESVPTEPTTLRVRNPDGSQAVFNTVIKANVGFPSSRLTNWCESPTRDGLVSLEKLPIGTHWLVAAAELSNRFPFQITIPTDQLLVERRLRTLNWSSVSIEIGRQPVVEFHDKEGEVILVEILNKSTAPLSLSEFDIELQSEFEHESIRGLSPKWLMADREPFPRTKIEAGQAGRMRLNWREWARQGLWSLRNHEPISEPEFAPDEPGKVWVRVKLGNDSSQPVAVTDPKVILAEAGGRRDADRQRLQGTWQFESEEQWGVLRTVDDSRTKRIPLGIEFDNDTVRGAFDAPWKRLSWQMQFLEDTPFPSVRLVTTASDGTRQTQLLLYRFQEGCLELCYVRGSSDRIPAEFKTSEGAKTIIWRLVRSTEAKKAAAVNEATKLPPVALTVSGAGS